MPPEDPAPGGGGLPLLVVKSGDARCGIPVGRVREVVRSRKMARIPDSRPPLRGLLSVRGEIVTVVDLEGLRDLLTGGRGGPEMSETGSVTTGTIRPTRVEAVVVLRGNHDPVGLEVDGVEDIRDFADAEGTAEVPRGRGGASPSTSTYTGRIWAGILRDARGEVGVLDADLLFEAVEAIAEREAEPAPVDIPGPREPDGGDAGGAGA